MAKPMLVTLPFTLLLLDYWPLKRSTLPPLWREKVPLFAMSAAACVVTVVAQRSGGTIRTLEHFPFAERLANSVLAYAGYLEKTFWPVSLAVFYPHSHTGLVSWTVAGCAALLAGITALALGRARTSPYLVVSWLWYVGTLVPVVGLVQVGEQSMADRYTYVPLIGIFVAIAWGAAELVEKGASLRYLALAAASLSLVALFGVTRAQVAYWSGNKTLWEHALAVTPGSFVIHNNLAGVLAGEGQIPAAIEHLEQALRLDPKSKKVRYNLADLLVRTGRTHEAIEHYSELLRAEPRATAIAIRLGQLLAQDDRLPEAIVAYQRAVALDPGHAEVRNALGIALAQANRLPEALEQFSEAVRIKPDYESAAKNLKQAEDIVGQRP